MASSFERKLVENKVKAQGKSDRETSNMNFTVNSLLKKCGSNVLASRATVR